MNSVSHARINSDVRSFPRLITQPPPRLELVRVFTPDGLITIKDRTRSFGDQDKRVGCEAYWLHAAMERSKTKPLGIGSRLRTFPEVVVMGLKSGNTSS